MSEEQTKVDSNRTGLAIAEEATLGKIKELFDITVDAAVDSTSTTNLRITWDNKTQIAKIEFDFDNTEAAVHLRVSYVGGGAANPGFLKSHSNDQPNEWSFSVSATSFAIFTKTGAPAGATTHFVIYYDLNGVLTADTDMLFEISEDDAHTTETAEQKLDVGSLIGPVWTPLEPNSYSDFGGETTQTARNPINASRQRQKGVTTDLEASGEFNQDMTQTLMHLPMKGFFFAKPHEQPSTERISGDAIVVDPIAAGNILTMNDTSDLAVGHIIRMNGYAINGDRVVGVTSVDSGTQITFGGLALNAEPNPPATARVEVCGFRQTASACNLSVSGNKVILTNATDDYTTLGLQVGQWIHVGGQATANRFVNNFGYARVAMIEANTLTLDQPTWANSVDEVGVALSIELFYGKFFRNEKEPAKIICFPFQLERTLGYDDDGLQSEYLIGCVADGLTINLPTAEKMNVDLEFMSLRNEPRDGLEGIKVGLRGSNIGQKAYNTANDLYLTKLYVHDDNALQPAALFAYVREATLTILNNAKVLKALGVLGGFNTSAGTFEVGGELTAYFSDVAAIKAVRNNADVGFYTIGAKDNQGFVFDMPLLSLAGGKLDIEQDEPVMIPLEKQAAECEHGYTASYSYFTYLPDDALPEQN